MELVAAEQVVERRPFPRNGGKPSQVLSGTGNNQPLRRGLLKSEDTPSPESGQGIPQIVEPESELPLVPNQDTCPESGLAGAHDMPGSKVSRRRPKPDGAPEDGNNR